ncbi:hypothetical protein HRbin33_01539 [bacterium HR33]|nr:hypothetical protein HRbin33_01539 [bacterium HR33]
MRPISSGLASYLSLFASIGTLICCALPSLLVLLGLGATVASVVSNFPFLITLSRNKEWVFAAAGVLIGLNFLYVYRFAPRLAARRLGCSPDDPACRVAGRISRVGLWVSAGLYFAGFFVAYLLVPILRWIEQ